VVIKYHDFTSNTVRYHPKTEKYPIWIRFNQDSTLIGNTLRNNVYGEYDLFDNNKISITSFGGTKVGEPAWGLRFWNKFREIESYNFKDDSLLFYLNSNTESLTFYDSTVFNYEDYQEWDTRETHYVHEEFLRYFGNFNEDSWWLYQRLNNDLKDSMYVSRYNPGMSYSDAYDSYNEQIFFIIESTQQDRISSNIKVGYDGNTSLFYFYYPISVGLQVWLYQDKYYGCDPIENPFTHTCDITVQKISTLEIDGEEYSDVIKVTDGKTSNPNPIIVAYYVQDIGLVRKEYKNGEIYDLVEYEIKE